FRSRGIELKSHFHSHGFVSSFGQKIETRRRMVRCRVPECQVLVLLKVALRVLDAAAGDVEIIGFALNADEPAALKERHLARRAAAEERVKYHVAGVAPTYDVVTCERLGEWRGVAGPITSDRRNVPDSEPLPILSPILACRAHL